MWVRKNELETEAEKRKNERLATLKFWGIAVLMTGVGYYATYVNNPDLVEERGHFVSIFAPLLLGVGISVFLRWKWAGRAPSPTHLCPTCDSTSKGPGNCGHETALLSQFKWVD